MNHNARVPVVVVGAGPTGATAAIELGQRGTECLVLDRWDTVYPQPRAVHLDDEVYRALARLGAGDGFAQVSRPGGGLRLMDRSLKVLGEFPRHGVSPSTGYPRANMFDQPELEEILRERLQQHPSVTLRGGVVVTGVEQRGPSRVTVHYRDVATGTVESVDTEVLLGCDGANSTVRESIGSTLEDLGFQQRWLVLDVATTVDLHQWEGVHQVCDTRRAATYMRIGETRYRWEFQLLDGEELGGFSSLEQVLPLLRPWLGRTGTDDLELLRAAEYTFKAAVADHWRVGRTFLLGDAAHLTPPFIGQGMGAGVRDAVNLGWKVAGFLSGALPADVLDSYEPERSAHARSTVQLARRVGIIMTRGGWVGDRLRGAVIPALTLTPALRRQVTDSTTPPLTGSSWVSTRRGDRLAGHLCPNPVVGTRRLDDVIGTGWALVTAVAPSPSDSSALAARGCPVVRPAGRDELSGWLQDGGATAALVRPDRTVLASGHDVPALCAAATTLLAPLPCTAPVEATA